MKLLSFNLPSFFLVCAILLSNSPVQAKDKKDIDTYQDEVNSLKKDIEDTRLLIRKKHETKAHLIGGAMNASFQGDCKDSCHPKRGASCTDADLAAVRLKSDSTTASPICEALYLKNTEMDKFSSSCRTAISECGAVAKKIEIDSVNESIKTLRLELTEKEEKLTKLRDKRVKFDEVCVECEKKKEGAGSWFKDLFSGLDLHLNASFGTGATSPGRFNPFGMGMSSNFSMNQMMMMNMYSNPALLAMGQASSIQYQMAYYQQMQMRYQYQYQMQAQTQAQMMQYQAQMQTQVAQYQNQFQAAQMNMANYYRNMFTGGGMLTATPSPYSANFQFTLPGMSFQTGAPATNYPGPFVGNTGSYFLYTGGATPPGGGFIH
jgi:hypothetical protein